MYDEMKKFYKTSAVLILLVLALLLSIVMPFVFIYDYECYDYKTGKEVVMKGIKGINERKEQVKATTGILETKQLNEAIALYKSLSSEEEAYRQVEKKYPEMFRFLKEAYAPYGEEGSFAISSILSADDFYNRDIFQINSRLTAIGENDLTKAEMQNILEKSKTIEKPYLYEFADQWTILFKSLIFVYAIIAFSGVLISSQLFSYEKEKDMDLILKSIGKKRLIRIGHKKMLAMVIYLSLEFIVCSTIVAAIVFSISGVSGWNSPLQILPTFFTSIYNWSIGNMFLVSLVISWLSITSIAIVGAFINSFFQKTYLSLIISASLMLLPLCLRFSDYVTTFAKKILYVHPTNGISILSYIQSLFCYDIGPMRISTPVMLGIFATLYCVLFLLLSPKLFATRLNK